MSDSAKSLGVKTKDVENWGAAGFGGKPAAW